MSGRLDYSFAGAASKVLPKMAGLLRSESTPERSTEDAGGRFGDRLDAGDTFGDKVVWPWRHDQHGRSVAYVSIDATSVPQQGPGGVKADGRMPYVAMVYNPPPEKAEPPPAPAAPVPPPKMPTSAKDKTATEMQARSGPELKRLDPEGLLQAKQ